MVMEKVLSSDESIQQGPLCSTEDSSSDRKCDLVRLSDGAPYLTSKWTLICMSFAQAGESAPCLHHHRPSPSGRYRAPT